MKTSTQKILYPFVSKIGIVSLMAICIALFNSNAKAQTLLVNYDFADAVAGTPCTATPLTTATNVTSVFTSGSSDNGPCITSEGGRGGIKPAVGYAFVSNPDANLAVYFNRLAAAEAVGYFQFQLNNVSAFRGYKIHFQRQRYDRAIDVQYSLDGVNFTSFVEIPFGIEPALAFPNQIVDMSSVTALDGQPTIYFRLATKTDSTSRLYFGIDNFQVQATTATKSRKRVRFF